MPAFARGKPLTPVLQPGGINTGLAAGWPMCDQGGPTIADVSGNDNTGTLTGGVTWVDGPWGKCLAFDSSGYVAIPATMSVAPPFTVAVSVYQPSSATSEYGVVSLEGGTASWGTYNGPNYEFEKGGVVDIDSGIAIIYDKWVRFVWTADSANRPSLYINGSLVFSSANTSAFVTTAGRSNAIGAEGSGLGNRFIGSLDNLLLFSRALSPQEIAQDCADSFAGYRPRRLVLKGASAAGGLFPWFDQNELFSPCLNPGMTGGIRG